MLMCALPNAADVRANYFAEDKWNTIQVIPDAQYNTSHENKRHVVVCACKDTLRETFDRLRHLKLTVVKDVNRKAWEGVLQSIRTCSTAPETVIKSPTQDNAQEQRSVPFPDPAPRVGSSEPDAAVESAFPSLRRPAATQSTSDASAETSSTTLPSTNSRDSCNDGEQADEADPRSYWQPAESTAVQMMLPPTWNIANVLADRGGDVESPLTVATLRYQHCRNITKQLSKRATETKDVDERRQMMLELEAALRSAVFAKKDLDEKAAIQRFLDQYQDRPEVPEHWAADPITHKYSWTVHNQHYVNKRRRPWKSINY